MATVPAVRLLEAVVKQDLHDGRHRVADRDEDEGVIVMTSNGSGWGVRVDTLYLWRVSMLFVSGKQN